MLAALLQFLNSYGKVTPVIKHHAVKTYEGVEANIHHALKGSRWSVTRSGNSDPWGKNPDYPLDRSLGGLQRL